MEHYKNLTAQQLSMLAACTLLMAGTVLSRSTALGVALAVLATAFGFGAYRKSRTR